ncbi:MAG: response regulator [Verrucomicrobiae bacterium]|nr:response regulator [Verrucomicrobiae bacterium]
MSLRFGIRGKIALLVVVAAAISAYLVARLLSRSAEDLVRNHELVDLGDEAQLRGWELADQVDGLREDLIALRYSLGFQEQLARANADSESLRESAEAACRRYWSRYLRIDVLTWPNGQAEPDVRLIEEKAILADDSAEWAPTPDSFIREGSNRVLLQSEIMRALVKRRHLETGEIVDRWEPVVWASATLAMPDAGPEAPTMVVRILMTLDDAQSPRHLFTLVSPDGKVLVRPDEFEEENGAENDAIFESIITDPEVQEGMRLSADEGAERSPGLVIDEPQVDGLKLFEYLPLASNYWFLEGIPGDALHEAIENDDEEDQNRFLDQLRLECENDGRIGGLRGGVRELRLLSPSPERLESLKAKVTAALADRFGETRVRFHWRQPVACDQIHAWAVRLGLGTVEKKTGYLLIYAVLDDELASSIHQEMTALRRFAFLVAIFAGAIAFMISLFFVKPLQRMTLTAQRVAEADPNRLPSQLRRLVDHLPVSRRDEVGDIARASKRLFEEVLDSQEKLENRVRERTAKLAQANLDLEEANEQLMSLSREKDAFVAKVSHDLRQPLNAIFLQVEALKLSDLDELQAKDVQRIHDHAARELNLVNDILEYQKIIMGAETLVRDEIDIAALLEDLEAAHAPTAKAKGLAFETEAGPNIGTFEADRRRLRQVLDNLCTNACKFTSEGKVRIEAIDRVVGGEPWVEFVVIDTGRGMKPEEQAKAFVPFVSNKQGNEGGTGLGLSICKELCVQMGGKVGFVSEPGEGTRFTVLLPRKATSSRYESGEMSQEMPAAPLSDEEATVEKAAPPAEEKPDPGTEILVIDDDEWIRTLMRRTLEGEGYQVITASDGDEGLRLAKKRFPDAITLDIVMPGLDGWEVLAKLKSDPDTESIPVIMVSVMGDRSESLALGVEDCLVKPVDLGRLSRVMRRVTGRDGERHLLVVDDDNPSREALRRLLVEEGWQPVEAGSGSEALEKLQEVRPAAIILDLLMPEMDGFEFLLELSRHPEWNGIPILVLTGAHPNTQESAFLKRRVDEVIEKGETSARQVIDRLRARLG